jgi:hypothetical protein
VCIDNKYIRSYFSFLNHFLQVPIMASMRGLKKTIEFLRQQLAVEKRESLQKDNELRSTKILLSESNAELLYTRTELNYIRIELALKRNELSAMRTEIVVSNILVPDSQDLATPMNSRTEEVVIMETQPDSTMEATIESNSCTEVDCDNDMSITQV